VAWEFAHSVEVKASHGVAWDFWTKVQNWAEIDPAIEWVELNGPFRAGAEGTTKQRGLAPIHWRIAKVREGESATIEIKLAGALARFVWQFEPISQGRMRLSQRMTIEGPETDNVIAGLGAGFTEAVRAGMKKLGDAIERASEV
jgi:hypothetical protein